MHITHFFAAQLERELPISRRVLERVPEGRPEWKPHEKSMPLGYLATLVATMPGWIAMAIRRDELDVHPKPGSGIRPDPWTTNAALLAQFEDSASQAREAIATTSADHLATSWRLLAAGKVVDERPRHEVISDTLCHAAHHRGQLTVYLRLLDLPVPSIYGPSADERIF